MNKDKQRGTFYIVAAPSGCGKSTVVNELVHQIDNLKVSISYTTRPIGAGEEHGKHYFFVTQEEFQELNKDGEFIETATVYGYQYGTSRHVLDNFLNSGFDVILDIDWQGARQIKALGIECTSVYLIPPSREELINRLSNRARESMSVINSRMEEVSEQVTHCSDFDYIIINDDFNLAVDEFRSIIQVTRLESKYQREKHKNIIQTLLAD